MAGSVVGVAIEDIHGDFLEGISRQAHHQILTQIGNFTIGHTQRLELGTMSQKVGAQIGKLGLFGLIKHHGFSLAFVSWSEDCIS